MAGHIQKAFRDPIVVAKDPLGHVRVVRSTDDPAQTRVEEWIGQDAPGQQDGPDPKRPAWRAYSRSASWMRSAIGGLERIVLEQERRIAELEAQYSGLERAMTHARMHPRAEAHAEPEHAADPLDLPGDPSDPRTPVAWAILEAIKGRNNAEVERLSGLLWALQERIAARTHEGEQET